MVLPVLPVLQELPHRCLQAQPLPQRNASPVRREALVQAMLLPQRREVPAQLQEARQNQAISQPSLVLGLVSSKCLLTRRTRDNQPTLTKMRRNASSNWRRQRSVGKPKRPPEALLLPQVPTRKSQAQHCWQCSSRTKDSRVPLRAMVLEDREGALHHR